MRKMIYYIFVDDEREDLFDAISNTVGYTYVHCHTYESAIDHLKLYEGNPIVIDLDHDLGLGKTGYDIAKYIVENHIELYGFQIHSCNPVGQYNIRQLLTHYGYKEIF